MATWAVFFVMRYCSLRDGYRSAVCVIQHYIFLLFRSVFYVAHKNKTSSEKQHKYTNPIPEKIVLFFKFLANSVIEATAGHHSRDCTH